MTGLTIRRADPEHDDYDAMAALWNGCHPDMPRAGPIWRGREAEDAERGTVGGRFNALRGDELVGLATYWGGGVAGEPGQLELQYAAPKGKDAAAILDALQGALDEAVASLSPPRLVAYARDTQPWMVAFFERHGFETVQRTVSSTYRPSGVEAQVLAEAIEALGETDWEILSARDLAAVDVDWKRSYLAMDRAVMRDIPFLGPVREESVDAFERRLADPTRFNADATFVARIRDTGDVVGVSLLQTFADIPGYAFAGMTGVVRAHRRRGIARVLKHRSLAWAEANGIERIVALNEESNPMLALNLDLGFVVDHVQATMEKRLGQCMELS